jgi:hypothetical protein
MRLCGFVRRFNTNNLNIVNGHNEVVQNLEIENALDAEKHQKLR